MASFFKTFYRNNCWPAAKRHLHDLFDADPNVEYAIVFIDVGFPQNGVTHRIWWKSRRSAFYRRIDRETYRTVPNVTCFAERSAFDFDALLASIVEADQPPLENFTAGIRDGVVYTVAWGDLKSSRNIIIRNPRPQSRHDAFISLLKNSAWIDQTGANQGAKV